MPGFPTAPVSWAWDFSIEDDATRDAQAATSHSKRRSKSRQLSSAVDRSLPGDEENASPNGARTSPNHLVPLKPLAIEDDDALDSGRDSPPSANVLTLLNNSFSALGPLSALVAVGDDGAHDAFVHEDDEDEDEELEDGITNDGRRRRDGKAFIRQRKITADLDPTDQLIVTLKRMNHPNAHIAEELRKAGLIPYDPKTIGSRFIRLETAISERETQRLEDELTDWVEGEDEALIRADELAMAEIKSHIELWKAKRWSLVSKYLQKVLKKDLKWGPKACEMRFTDLMAERASIPINLDDDPDARRAERARRVLDKMNERVMVQAQEEAVKEKRKVLVQQQSLERKMAKSRRLDEKAQKAIREAELARARAEAAGAKHNTMEQKRAHEQPRMVHAMQTYAEANGIDYPAAYANTASFKAITAASPATPASASAPMSSTTKKRKRPGMDTEVSRSPRNRLSVKELSKQLGLRGLTKGGSKQDQIKRLDASDQRLTTRAIQDTLAAKGLNTGGTRSELIHRLVISEVQESAWGQKHAVAVPAERTPGFDDEPVATRAKSDETATGDAEGKRAASVDSGVGAEVGA